MTVTFRAWPEERYANRSFQVTRMLGLIDFGGSDFTEIHEAIQRIDPDDIESWYREWFDIAQLCEQQAYQAERSGNRLTARYGYQRASNYYRACQFYMPGSDERKIPTLRKVKDTFQAAIPFFDFPCEPVSIPYEGTTLDGYFVPSRVGGSRLPTILYLNGLDSLSEEAYFTVALPASIAGYNCIIFNAPGVGLSLYEKGLTGRYDAEHFVSPVLDILLARADVDPDRIAVVGESFAAYLVPRAAAMEPRLAAAISWGASYSWGSCIDPAVTHPLESRLMPLTPHVLSFFGARDFDELKQIRLKFALDEVIDRIICPYLVLVGVEDFAYNSATEAVRVYERIKSSLKRVVIIERDQILGGVMHCNKDNLHVMHAHSFNFLNEAFGYQPGAALTVRKLK